MTSRTVSGDLPRTIAFHTDARAWGGAEVYMEQLIRELRHRGFDTPVIAADWPAAASWLDHLEELGFSVTRYRCGKELSPRMFRDAARLLRGHEFVHVNKTHPRNCLPAILTARSVGVRALVATEHLATPPVSHYPMGQAVLTWLVRFSNRSVDRTIAVSELSRKELIRNYAVPRDRIVAIRNGIDTSVFDAEHDVASVRAHLGLGDDDIVVVLVGALIERKGQSVALRALASMREAFPSLRLVLVGEGENEASYRSEAESLGVADLVVWAGFRRDVPAILAAADMLILPSDIECLPFVVLEAMGAGLPVVATDVGGISEQVEDGVTGRIVPPRDAGALAAAMADVLASADGGAAMGKAGRARLEREFSVTACVDAVLRVYDDVWRERTGRGDDA